MIAHVVVSIGTVLVFAIPAVHFLDRSVERGDVHHSRKGYRLDPKSGAARPK